MKIEIKDLFEIIFEATVIANKNAKTLDDVYCQLPGTLSQMKESKSILEKIYLCTKDINHKSYMDSYSDCLRKMESTYFNQTRTLPWIKENVLNLPSCEIDLNKNPEVLNSCINFLWNALPNENKAAKASLFIKKVGKNDFEKALEGYILNKIDNRLFNGAGNEQINNTPINEGKLQNLK